MTRGRLTKFLRDSLEGYSGVTVANFDSRQPTLFPFSFYYFFFLFYFFSNPTSYPRSIPHALSFSDV